MASIALKSGVTAPAVIFPHQAEIYPALVDPSTSGTIAAGSPGYLSTAGYLNPATSAGAAHAVNQQFKGITLETGGPRQGVSLLKRGTVGGYDLTGLNVGQVVYLQDAGGLGTTAGTNSVAVGQVVPLSDAAAGGNGTTAIYFDANWSAGY